MGGRGGGPKAEGPVSLLAVVVVGVCSLYRPTEAGGGSESPRSGDTAISLPRSNSSQADRVWLARGEDTAAAAAAEAVDPSDFSTLALH